MSWSGGYTAPKSYPWGGKPPASPAAPPVAAPPPPPPPAGGPSAVAPFFHPEDLITQNNFWAQWNDTFAGLDKSLADLQRNTAFERAQLADTHKSNVSGINDNAAARGLSQSSIRDGSQAQEQTQFTRQDQNLQDALNSFATYVQTQKNNFNTNTLPGFNTAEDAQAAQNAQDANNVYVPPPAAPQAAAPPAQQVTSSAAKPYKPV
ncbi:MAG: hypothetical protein ACXVGB_00680, partial [Mycobacteriaceae bacterium]